MKLNIAETLLTRNENEDEKNSNTLTWLAFSDPNPFPV